MRSPGAFFVQALLVGAGLEGVWRLGSKSEDAFGLASGLVNVRESVRGALVDCRSLGGRVLRDGLVWEELVAGVSVVGDGSADIGLWRTVSASSESISDRLLGTGSWCTRLVSSKSVGDGLGTAGMISCASVPSIATKVSVDGG